eukprot:TRINITY_DN12477_c0_g1_i1.p1 TRINITY_DN12477_c0_g1~~TRINITY_DN12477_c0_g1_i1.p1  ORF type:complete len:149 (+),score=28.46 TRINITY_DN12477_c0_g1_i1:119-565(+)
MCIRDRASALAASSDHNKAIAKYREAIDMKIKLHGKDSESLTATWNCLGQSYAAKGDQEKAVEAFKEEFRITELVYGKDCEECVGIYKNIGVSYKEWNKFAEARQALNDGIALAERLEVESLEQEIENMRVILEEVKNKEGAAEQQQE